jgi:PadR family transcriptional regulator, regulatory protein PadR
MKRTRQLVEVARALMAEPEARHWGYDLSRQTRLRSGVLYPILHRMYDEKWLADGWETFGEGRRQRPPRRYYELTDLGRWELGALLATEPVTPRRRLNLGRPATGDAR